MAEAMKLRHSRRPAGLFGGKNSKEALRYRQQSSGGRGAVGRSSRSDSTTANRVRVEGRGGSKDP